MNFHTSRLLFQKDSSYKSQFCKKVRAPSRLVIDVWAKSKDLPIKILKRDVKKTQVNNNKKKDLRLKSSGKLAKE